jgi:hypothetical protein
MNVWLKFKVYGDIVYAWHKYTRIHVVIYANKVKVYNEIA